VVTLRLCFAAILIVLMFRSWSIMKRLPHLKWKDLLSYTAALCLMNILFYASLGKLPQGIAVGLEFLGPLTLALLSIKQRRDYIWVGLAILGIALMVPWHQANATNFFLRSRICGFSGCLLGAVYLFWAKSRPSKYRHACPQYCYCDLSLGASAH
jgi:inner membrane transporter RhtA